MPSAEKSEIKVAAAGEILADLETAARNAENNRVALQATQEALKRVLKRYGEYRKNSLDKSFEDGTIPEEAREYVLACFQDMTGMVGRLGVEVGKQMVDIRPFTLGLAKAITIVKKRRANERLKGEQALRDEEEEDRYRKERDEGRSPEAEVTESSAIQKQGNGNKPASVSEEPVSEEPPAEEEATPEPEAIEPEAIEPEAIEPGAIEPEAIEPEAPAEEVVTRCGHCKDEITIDSGTDVCSACISHKNKYGKLPSDKALKNRRARQQKNQG